MSVSKICVSVSYVKALPAYNLKRFKTKRLASFDELIRITLSHAWSPCVWEKGIRLQDNFREAFFLAIDYDNGVSIHDTMSTLNSLDLQYFLTTTKSHQIEKITQSGKVLPACDRYRVIVPINESLATNEEQFQWQMRKVFRDFPGCDKSCVDSARFYQPGTKLVAKNFVGAYYTIPEPPSVKSLRQANVRQMRNDRHYAQNNVIPRWIHSMLLKSSSPGERNQTCFVAARKLAALGFDFGTIENVIFNSAIDLPTIELKRTINNGAKKGYRDIAAYG